jgi:hypothetical protein
MRMRVGQLICFALLLIMGGCKGMFGGLGLPADPLFADRKAVESKAQTGPPVATPDREPTPPTQTFWVGR